MRPLRLRSARRLAGLLGWMATVGCGTVGCGTSREPAPEAPGLLLITLDTFRQDHLGCDGNPDVRTPHLDRLERRGMQWLDAVTAIPLTTPSHATILTGMTPRAHRLIKNRMRLDATVPTLATRLQERGWRTGAIVSSKVVLGPDFGLDRGFDQYQVIEPAELPASGEGALTADRAIQWLEPNGGPGSLLWVHFFDAHLPYLPPGPLNRLYAPGYAGNLDPGTHAVQQDLREDPNPDPDDIRFLAAQYAGEVSFVDSQVGRLLQFVERVHPATTVLVTADHGEGLYEHRRYFGHDILMYETAVRVPFLLAGPGVPTDRYPSRLAPQAARTVDVAPTLLGLVGIDPDNVMEGRDLPGEPARTGDDLQFVTESHPSRDKSRAVYALRTGDAKVVWGGQHAAHEAYDLTTDPGETNDLAAQGLRLHQVMLEDLQIDLRERPPGVAKTVDSERGGLDDETREALESLGYVDR